MNQDYTDVCPLLDRSTVGENYLQPVKVNRNIELVTRNLPAQVMCYNFYSVINV